MCVYSINLHRASYVATSREQLWVQDVTWTQTNSPPLTCSCRCVDTFEVLCSLITRSECCCVFSPIISVIYSGRERPYKNRRSWKIYWLINLINRTSESSHHQCIMAQRCTACGGKCHISIIRVFSQSFQNIIITDFMQLSPQELLNSCDTITASMKI